MAEPSVLTRVRVEVSQVCEEDTETIIDYEVIRGDALDQKSFFAKRVDVISPNRQSFFPAILLLRFVLFPIHERFHLGR